MLASIVHIVNGDWGSLVVDLTEMDVVKPGTNLRLVTMVLSTDHITSIFIFQFYAAWCSTVFAAHFKTNCFKLKWISVL